MTTILIGLILLAVAMIRAYHNHLTNEVIKDIKIDIKQLYSTIEMIRDIEKTSVNIDKIIKDRLNALSDELDLYKRLFDSLKDAYAQLNLRMQQLEMLNSNGAILTGEYDLHNPPSILLHKTNGVEKGGCPYTPNGLCGNPQHDCVGCPNHGTSGVITTTSQQLPPEAIHFTKED